MSGVQLIYLIDNMADKSSEKVFKTSLEIRLQNRERLKRYRQKAREERVTKPSKAGVIYKTFEWMSFNTSEVYIDELLALPVRFIVFQRESCYLHGYCEMLHQRPHSSICKMFMDPDLCVVPRTGSRMFAISMVTIPHNRIDGPWSAGCQVVGRGVSQFPFEEQKEEEQYFQTFHDELVWLSSPHAAKYKMTLEDVYTLSEQIINS